MRKLPTCIFPVSQHPMPIRLSQHKTLKMSTARLHVPLILPEVLWKGLFSSENIRQFVVASDNALETFWKDVGDTHPALVHHPVKRYAGYRRKAVPLVLHGDGAAITQQIGSNSKSCLFLSFRALTAENTQKHFLMSALWTSAIAKGKACNTVSTLFRIVSENFQKLLDLQGQGTSGYFPVVVFTTGDLEYFSDFHAVPRWNSNYPCALCGVRKEVMGDYKQIPHLQADPWRLPRGQTLQCPLFKEVMSTQGICPDLMHSKHLGTDLRLLGSVVWILIFELMTETTLEDRMASLLHSLHAPR